MSFLDWLLDHLTLTLRETCILFIDTGRAVHVPHNAPYWQVTLPLSIAGLGVS